LSKTIMKLRSLCALLAAGLLAPLASRAQPPAPPHLQKQGTATQLIVDGRPFLVLGGEVHNSSSSSLDYMQPIWPKFARAQLNTLLAPVSWELIEPEEGKFDFTLVDGLIKAAREHHLRLGFLWFGTWKNLVSSYAPVWVRAHPERFACVVDQAGNRLPIISTFSEAALQADSKAFAALMRHLRQAEAGQPRATVLMVQVENEVGLGGGTRDCSAAANEAFAQPVPPELLNALLAHPDSLDPELKQLWEAAGAKATGTWEQVFGPGAATNEIFMAWQYARYLGKVIAAGKAEYPLPMFVNASVGRQDGKVGTYPSGGPLANVGDIWRVGAPQLDILSPDIYYGNFAAWCDKYTRAGNPLFIPEMRAGADGAVNALTAIANNNAIGCSPFAIEDTLETDGDYRDMLNTVAQLSPLILAHQGQGTMALAVVDGQNPARKLPLGRYTLNIDAVRNRNTTPEAPTTAAAAATRGYALVIATGPEEYFVAGRNVQITFSPNPAAPEVAAVAAIDEGTFVDGQWKPGRRLNGDETMLSYSLSQLAANNQTGTGARFGAEKPAIYRITLVQYPASATAAK
jgi:hypothetical protein